MTSCEHHGVSCAEEKLSPTQRQVFDILKNNAEPMSAYEVLAEMTQSKVTAPPTVYRALSILIDRGLVHRIESLNAYACCDGDHGHRSWFYTICEKCQRAEENELPSAVATMMAEVMQKTGFLPRNLTYEVAGLCQSCQAVETPR